MFACASCDFAATSCARAHPGSVLIALPSACNLSLIAESLALVTYHSHIITHAPLSRLKPLPPPAELPTDGEYRVR